MNSKAHGMADHDRPPTLRVWVTGAGGLIGHQLMRTASACVPDWEVCGLTREQLDLTDLPTVGEAFRRSSPDIIIHCAAISRNPVCQANPDLAWRTNDAVTRHLADLAAVRRLIFFSTDLVFDGRQGHYRETDTVNPLGVYAETKAAAEQVVLANPRHLVIRTSLNGGTSPTGDRGFNEELRRAWAAGNKPKLFVDEFRSPIPAEITARAVWALARDGVTGILHVAGRERLSRWEIGRLLADRWPQLNPQIEPSRLQDYAGPPRAPDTSLDCTRVQALLPFPLLGLREWLAANPQAKF